MKKKLLTLAVALLAATGAWAQTFTVDNLKYEVTDAEAKTVTLTGYETAPTGALTIPATVTNESTEYSVTSIGSGAFINCYSLTAVTISDGVTSIGKGAFKMCNGITSVTIPVSVTSIGESAFGNCQALTAVTIPDGVTQIGNYAFNRCSALTAINVAEGNTAYCSDGGVLFNKDKTTLIQYPAGKTETDYAVPTGVTSIAKYAFAGSNALTEVTLPEGLTEIAEYAFAWCRNLTKISLPEGLTDIAENAFALCRNLTKISLPEGLTDIAENAFAWCRNLTKISLPESLDNIGNMAFGECTGLTEMTVLATVPPTVAANTFKNVSRTIPVYVPAASLADYQAAEVWKEFTNLQAIGSTGLQTPSMPESIAVYDGMLHNPQQLHLTLYDMQGRQVYSGTAATVSLNAGVYVVRCNGASGKVLF